jgi:hypothetical protein
MAGISYNRAAMESILQAPEILADVRARAERVRDAAGPGFEMSSMIGAGRAAAGRARASVRAESFSARVRNSRENILIRALEAGRG